MSTPNYQSSEEARAVREQRQAMRRHQAADPLKERVRLIRFWQQCALTNRHYAPHNGAWWFPFIVQPGFRRLLMPKLRAMLSARDKAHRDKHAADMHESAARWAIVKAERAAAKARAKAPQLDLLDAAA